MADRLLPLLLAPTMTPLVIVGFFVLGVPSERAISAVSVEHAAAVESAHSPVDDKPFETQLVTAGPGLSLMGAPVEPRLRTVLRQEPWRSDLVGNALRPATRGALRRSTAEDALPALRLAAHAGRVAAPSTAPPTLPA